MGRSEQNEIVHFAFAGDAIGQLVPVRITEAYDNSLRGQVQAGFVAIPSTISYAKAQTQPKRRALPVVTGP
jgi:TRAM domain